MAQTGFHNLQRPRLKNDSSLLQTTIVIVVVVVVVVVVVTLLLCQNFYQVLSRYLGDTYLHILKIKLLKTV